VLLAEQGFTIVHAHVSKLELEARRTQSAVDNRPCPDMAAAKAFFVGGHYERGDDISWNSRSDLGTAFPLQVLERHRATEA
jgi:hypothetical protein